MEFSTNFTTRQSELTAAKEARTLLDRFRNGTAIDLNELLEKLTTVTKSLSVRIEKDNLLLREGLQQMTYLDGSLKNEVDGLESEFTFKKGDPHAQELLEDLWATDQDSSKPMDRNIGQAISETLELPNLAQVTEAVNCVLGVFDLTQPDVDDDKYLATYRVLADLLNGYRGTDLDPLREQLAGIVDFDQEPSQATDNERGVRELGSVLAHTIETRIQHALVGTAAASITALVARNLDDLKEAAPREMLTQVRMRTAWKFALTLTSLTGQQKF